MSYAHTGSKIRERRKLLGRTQAALAAEIGISASYLNLIEANKRQIGGRLLHKAAAVLEVDLESLDGAAERRLAEHLAELAGEPLFGNLDITPSSAFDLVGRQPEWARALVLTYRALQDQKDMTAALSDRLQHDPFLGEAVHTMLTNVTAIRSAAEILESVDDLDMAQRGRFDRIIGEESERLADVATKLAAYFDKAETKAHSLAPRDEVDELLWEKNNYFPALEKAAASLNGIWSKGAAPSEPELITRLEQEFGITVETVSPPDLSSQGSRNDWHHDVGGRRLIFAETIQATTKRFQMARLAAALSFRDLIERELDASNCLTTPDARKQAFRALSSYAAGALLMPYRSFRQHALDVRYDVTLLAQKHRVSIEQACHRLVTLRRPDEAGIPFAFMRSDPAGFVTKRFPLPRLPLPRYGNACPLWAVYSAFQSPGIFHRQIAELPNGDRFLFIAGAIAKEETGFQERRHLVSIMLACDALYAGETIYADGLDLSAIEAVTPIGLNCRLCPREACRHREEDPIVNR